MLMLTTRQYRHNYYKRRTAAYEATALLKKFYPWRAALAERQREEEEIRRAQGYRKSQCRNQRVITR